MGRTILTVLAIVGLLIGGCSMTSKATDFSGLTTPDGKATHLNTTNVAINLLFTNPVVGDASIHETVAECTRQAQAAGASKVRLVQSHSTVYWWIFPPISFIIHPVVTNVAADAL